MSIDRIPIPLPAGAFWLAARRDVAPDPESALERANHASTIVCLNEEHELTSQYPDYPVWLRANAGQRALWYPTTNFAAGRLEATLPALDEIARRLRDRQGVVMHCAMGQGRAGTMAVCVLIVLGASRADALDTVAAHRTFAGPGGPSQWELVDAVAETRR